MTGVRVYERGEPYAPGYGAMGIPIICNAREAEDLPDGTPYMLVSPEPYPASLMQRRSVTADEGES